MSHTPQQPDCKHCIHYFITHDVNFRYGCRALNFKSQQQPMLDVIASSGEPCHFFCKKQRNPKSAF